MSTGLRRFHESGQSHFIKFTCYRRHALLETASAKRTFELALERVRRVYRLCVYGYVVMPEHVHVLLSEPEVSTLAQAIKSRKQGVSRRLIGDAERFWQTRYYDHNIRSYNSFVDKLKYIHRNPVKRGLCDRPEDWEWIATTRRELKVLWRSRRNGQQTDASVRESRCEHLLWPTQANIGLEWATISSCLGPPAFRADSLAADAKTLPYRFAQG